VDAPPGPSEMSEAVALAVLAASLVAAITRPKWAPDWAVAAGGALLLLATGDLQRGAARSTRLAKRPQPPWFALAVVALALVGFALSSLVGLAPVWIAAAAALVLVARERPAPSAIGRAAEPKFLVFVLGLGIVVYAASEHGLSGAVDTLLPRGEGLPALMGVAAISAVAANLLNNLPATLIILPVAASSGAGAVLAMLVGVNVGPNLTYVGSLATLLWRRIVHAHDHDTDVGELTLLGLRTVPAALIASTVALWLALQVL
jgi:arsenical pump membrane protein